MQTRRRLHSWTRNKESSPDLEIRQDIKCRFATDTIHSLARGSRSSQRDRLDERDRSLPVNMAETSNDDDVKSNKRSHADITGDDGPGMLP